jgi:hypothetical protein
LWSEKKKKKKQHQEGNKANRNQTQDGIVSRQFGQENVPG